MKIILDENIQDKLKKIMISYHIFFLSLLKLNILYNIFD